MSKLNGSDSDLIRNAQELKIPQEQIDKCSRNELQQIIWEKSYGYDYLPNTIDSCIEFLAYHPDTEVQVLFREQMKYGVNRLVNGLSIVTNALAAVPQTPEDISTRLGRTTQEQIVKAAQILRELAQELGKIKDFHLIDELLCANGMALWIVVDNKKQFLEGKTTLCTLHISEYKPKQKLELDFEHFIKIPVFTNKLSDLHGYICLHLNPMKVEDKQFMLNKRDVQNMEAYFAQLLVDTANEMMQ